MSAKTQGQQPERQDEPSQVIHVLEIANCPLCRGKGRLMGLVCPKCNGLQTYLKEVPRRITLSEAERIAGIHRQSPDQSPEEGK